MSISCYAHMSIIMSVTAVGQPQNRLRHRLACLTPRTETIDVSCQEWDATMLEQHNLRQQLQNTRQELSHALYQGDGAIRVIARLKKERDEARHMLETVQRAPPAPAAAEPAEAAPEMTNGKRAAEDGTEGGGKRVIKILHVVLQIHACIVPHSKAACSPGSW